MVLRRLPRSVAVYANNSNMLFHAQGELEILRETALEAPPLVLEPPSPAEEHSAQVEGLPSDVLSQVLKRLFGFQLPVTVCKGWAVACQDKALWRSYCHAAWGAQCDPGRWGNDWQLMYRQRARALRHGVYCVHVSYTRGGDNPESVEQSWHAVDYYRYFCFLGQGSCLVSRSFLRPALVAEQLAPVFSSTAPADQVAREGSTQGLALYSGQWSQSKGVLTVRACTDGGQNEFEFEFVNANLWGEPTPPNQTLLLRKHVVGNGNIRLKAGFMAVFVPFSLKVLRAAERPQDPCA